ncbi:LacI family DNA-binding transcriptional regulator [Lichenihabitans sp. Uapishka_5]|uniref:LacI family DNA-binding transcriptional regulator n=1 Tax=Lichenihabitans sp. Uapishka_5 TaxID=3037302 RepID=UPI0029E7E0FE|nr:LacI family DNA-binding transcriptional regulator [Lichenihabitans sp. Uapishka_5]MDX7952614.1 LacI family DNA-binding transcriptional regulator [Lichenihabitans sp. Uapishka_5]
MHARPITLSDVAQRAGVSEITVSRVLRGVGPLAEGTRLRVMAVVEEMGYVPNRLAGTLASAVSGLVGVSVPSLSNIVFPEVLRGIHAGLEASGRQAVIGITDYDLQAEETLIGSLLAWKPAAMIVVGSDHTPVTSRRLRQSGIRVAELMDCDVPPIDLVVGMSHKGAGQATARHLIARGYRRFAYVGHDWTTDRRARLRYEGLCETLREGGLGLVAEMLSSSVSSTEAGRATLKSLLATRPDVDVVVFSNDDMAVGGVFHCMTAGLRPRTDLGLFGFNGLEIGQSLPQPLSTIRSNRYLIGRLAAEKILQRIDRPEGGEVIDTGFEICEGETA